MKVQRIRHPETDQVHWLVLDDQFQPIKPIHSYLSFRASFLSPNTVKREAYHLKLFWDYLVSEHLQWTDVNLEQLAGFIEWMRRPQLEVKGEEAKRTDATIDLALSAVHEFYTFHARMPDGPKLSLYQFVMMPKRNYKPMLHGIAKSKLVRTRLVKLKPEKRLPKTLTQEHIDALKHDCTHVRDQLLVALLEDTGIRIGQLLGLRHEDIRIEDGEIRLVPRNDNVNGARSKTHRSYSVYPSQEVFSLYVQYVVDELNGLDADTLPDYVFINLWSGEIGRPMTYDAVRSLYRRLQKRVSKHAEATVPFTPYKLRHTFATARIKEGVSLPTVSRLLGHSSIQTTVDIYHHVTDQDLRAELEDARRSRSRGDE